MENDRRRLAQPRWLAPALAGAVFLMGLAYAPRAQADPPGRTLAWEFPAGMQTAPMSLSALEREWLMEGGAESADRLRFNWQGVSGSMILITSRTWRAHHRPERCFQVYGLQIDSGQTYMAAADFPVRTVALGDRSNPQLYSAAYWFQSRQHITDDYATRIWDDLAPNRRRWVLVTILFDGAPDPGSADLQAFYHALRTSVQRGLEGGGA
jgi:exosortase O